MPNIQVSSTKIDLLKGSTIEQDNCREITKISGNYYLQICFANDEIQHYLILRLINNDKIQLNKPCKQAGIHSGSVISYYYYLPTIHGNTGIVCMVIQEESYQFFAIVQRVHYIVFANSEK